MSQFLIEKNNVVGNKIFIYKNDKDFKHIFKVSRVKVGETIKLLDDNFTKYLAKVSEINIDFAVLDVLDILDCKKNSLNNNIFTLYQCLPKLNKMDSIIEKSVELGVDIIVPVFSKNTVVKLDKKDYLNKISRWNEIIISAVKQSESCKIPRILEPINFFESISKVNQSGLNLIGWENGNRNLKTIFDTVNIEHDEINLMVGSEGGFDIGEIDEAIKYGWHDFRLNGNILRVETASVVLISVIKYQLGLI